VAVEEIAAGHAERQVALARRTAVELGKLWRHVDRNRIAASWGGLLPQVLAILGTSQATAAAAAGLYVDDALAESGVSIESAGRVQPGAFAGIASDGRPLASLMLTPAITTLEQIKQGATPARALTSGRFVLDLITRTQVADAGRVAVGTAIAARPEVGGYVRMIVGKTCARCLILAGRRYRWNEGFRRHPRCDCRHVPVAENVPGDLRTDPQAYFDSLDKAGQDELLGKAGAEAVRSGADMAKVVNARHGMQTAADGRLYTTEAAGKRPRLMPEQIFRDARDRDDAIRLLRLHGYIR
jgi:hypothetical protein